MRCPGPNRVKELPRQAASLVSKRLFSLTKNQRSTTRAQAWQGAFRHHENLKRFTPAQVVRFSCSNSMNSWLSPRLSFDSGKEKHCAGHRHGSASHLREVDQTSGAEYLDFACCYAGLLGVFRRYKGSPPWHYFSRWNIKWCRSTCLLLCPLLRQNQVDIVSENFPTLFPWFRKHQH